MTRFLPLLLVLTFTPIASAQTPASPLAPPTPPATEESSPPPAPPPDYAYSINGRRDPFVPLMGRTEGRTAAAPPVRGEGVAGLLADEIVLRGILLSQGRWVAMVTGPAGKVYTVHPGDRVADGTIREITQQYIAILQEGDDPVASQNQREVRKFLRGGENK